MQKIFNYIHGKLQAPRSEQWLENFNPATGKVSGAIARSSAADLEAAIQGAQEAFPSWSSLKPSERADWLYRLACAVEEQSKEFAQAESLDTGKPISLARSVDIPRSIANLRFFAGAATHFASESHFNGQGSINYTVRAPLGVVACISPWNLPLYLFTWKIAPALAAGNCVVGKPSEVTPLTAFMLSQACEKIDFPKGVLNIVHGLGSEIGDPLCRHPQVTAISFTGSTRTGASIQSAIASQFKKVSLEMGGKNPTLIFADANLDQAIEHTVRAAFTNQGQICLCGSRILIERSIYPQVRDALVKKTSELKIGAPLDPQTQIGSVVSKDHFEKIMSAIETAKTEGGEILVGGKRFSMPGQNVDGYFIEPTLLEGLDANCSTNQEEIFGPIASLIPFDTEKQALEIANGTRYGLAASLWSQDIDRCHRVSMALQCGIVWVNTWMNRDLRTPFGGVKDSGMGREGGFEAMRFFTEAKNICHQYRSSI